MVDKNVIKQWDLYVIADVRLSRNKSHAKVVEAVLKGGAKVVQLREKNKTFKELVQIAKECRKITKHYGAAFIVNDDPLLAREVNADGVHVGQGDTSVNEARAILGDNRIIGLSTHTREQLTGALLSEADYFSVGPVFPSLSKKSEYKPVGTALLKWAVKNSSNPIVVIGGINFRNIDMVLKTGARIVAVISAVMEADDITKATRQLINAAKCYRGLV